VRRGVPPRCVWDPRSLHTAEATEPCKPELSFISTHRRPNLPSSKLRDRDKWGVTDGHVSRQGPSLRLRSAGLASTRLLPGPVADAWADPWLLAAPGALRRRQHPSGAALARPLRTWAVRFAPCHPRHSYCMARKGLGSNPSVHTRLGSSLGLVPVHRAAMAADSLRRWTSLASSTFSRSQEPVIRQATFGSFRCGPQQMCQLAKRSLWI